MNHHSSIPAVIAAAFATVSCGPMKKAGNSTVAVMRKSSSAVTSGVESLMPGPKIDIVQPREEDFRDFQTGSELAQSHRRGLPGGGGFSNFWLFSEKLYFEEPDFSEGGSDDILLPPVPEP